MFSCKTIIPIEGHVFQVQRDDLIPRSKLLVFRFISSTDTFSSSRAPINHRSCIQDKKVK